VVWTDGDLAAEDLAVGAELGVQVLVVPAGLFEALNKNGSALNISASWLTSDGVHVVRKHTAHETVFDSWISVILNCLLGVLDRVKHDECIVAMLE